MKAEKIFISTAGVVTSDRIFTNDIEVIKKTKVDKLLNEVINVLTDQMNFFADGDAISLDALDRLVDECKDLRDA